jgi:hypothetical protein
MRVKRCFDILFLILGLAVTGTALAADPPPRFPNEHISLADWQAYLDEVKLIPDVHCEKSRRSELYCVSDSLTSIWVFTETDHPAHPAVSTVVLAVYTHSDGMLFRAYYAGNESAFRAWAVSAIGDPPIMDKWMQAPFKGGA